MLLGDVSSRYADLVESVFSSAIAGKAWLATGAVVLAIVQVLTASRMWGKLQGVVPVSFATSRRIHRWSGRVALLLTLPVFFHCVTILGFRTPDARIAIHSIAGSFVYGVVAAKLLVIWRKGYQHWVLPVLGGSLATILATLWLTSSFWYFTSVRFGFLMARRFAPLLVLVAVSLAVFGLAKWHPFSPTVPAAVTAPPARNAVRGAAIFATSCAGCHGAEATGGVGPALRGSGLTAAEVAAVVASGRGVMPAGIVTGQDAADVAAHVASIAK